MILAQTTQPTLDLTPGQGDIILLVVVVAGLAFIALVGYLLKRLLGGNMS